MVKKKENPTALQTVVTPFLAEPMALGEIFMQSGMFNDVKSQAQAVVKILAGRELGLAPLESMTNIYLVNGKVALQSKLIGALIKKSNKYDYTIDKLDEKECTITFYQLNATKERTEIGKSTFTIQDAARAGIVNKEVWKNYPRNMLYARAIANGARWYVADIFCGYTTEEVEENPVLAESTITMTSIGEIKKNDNPTKTSVQ